MRRLVVRSNLHDSVKVGLRSLATLLAFALVVLGGFLTVQLNRRPSLEPYALLVVPPAAPDVRLRVRFAGVATLVFSDGETAWMTDGFFSRPSFVRVVASSIEPNRKAIEDGLRMLDVTELAAVVPLHSHYDHAMDAPVVAMQTDALLIGSRSTMNIGLGLGMPVGRLREVHGGDGVTLGQWKLTFLESRHVPLPWFLQNGGDVEKQLEPPAHASAWSEGTTWALCIEHASGARMLVIGSAGFKPGALDGCRASTVFLGIAGIQGRPWAERDQWWAENVLSVGARRVIPIHWDDLSRSIAQPLAPSPYLVDDFGRAMTLLLVLAQRNNVEVRLPPLLTPFVP